MAQRKARAGWTAVAVVAVLILVLSGCGGSGGNPLSLKRTDLTGDSPPEPDSVSCASASFCLAVSDGLDDNGGSENAQSLWNGKRWSAPTTILRSLGVFQPTVSCPSPKFCALLTGPSGGAGNPAAAIWNGQRWSAPATLDDDTPSQTVSLSCPSAGFCMATDGNVAWRYSGASWSHPLQAPGGPQSTGMDGFGPLACTSRTFCLSVGLGQTDVWRGTSWAAASPPPPNWFTEFLACTAPDTCTMLGHPLTPPGSKAATAEESASRWTGGRWSAPVGVAPIHGGTRADPQNISQFSGLACPTASRCFAINQDGTGYESTDDRWSAVGAVEGSDADPSELSCPTIHFCASTDGRHQGLLATKG